MPNGNEWYGGRLPGWDWWRNWAYGGPGTRQYPRELPGMREPYGGAGRFGRTADMPPFGPQWNRMAARRPQAPSGVGLGPPPEVSYAVPGQATPSEGFGMVPYGGMPGPYGETRATPGTIPTQEGWVRQAIGLTPVEAALARIGEMAAGQQPAEPERPEAQFPGYWEAIGQQPGNYPVPQGAVQGMWGPRRPWEEWSWRTRGIPLQGNEILRVEGGRMPWGGRGGGGRRRGGREEPEPEPPAWQPGAWSGTF